jgi:hydrogenase-4 component B
VAGLVLLGRPRREEVAAAVDAPPAMRAALVFLAGLCVIGGLVPGLLLILLAGLAPGDLSFFTDTPGLALPGTGGLPGLPLLLALVVVTALLVRARGSRRAAPAPSWACGQPVTPALNWTSAGFTKPLRLVLEALLRPRRELEVVRAGGIVQRIHYTRAIASPSERLLYRPVIRAALAGAAVARRLQTGNVRTYAAYLLALVLVLLALVRAGALG